MAKPAKPAAAAQAENPLKMIPKAKDAPPVELALKVSKPKKAFTVERVEGGWRWVTFTYETEGGADKILSVTRSEPDLKSITIETVKIALFNYWTKGVEG